MGSDGRDRASPRPGCPIREPPDQRLLTAPRSFSQPSTPFIGSRRLGIHRAPSLAQHRTHARRRADRIDSLLTTLLLSKYRPGTAETYRRPLIADSPSPRSAPDRVPQPLPGPPPPTRPPDPIPAQQKRPDCHRTVTAPARSWKTSLQGLLMLIVRDDCQNGGHSAAPVAGRSDSIAVAPGAPSRSNLVPNGSSSA